MHEVYRHRQIGWLTLIGCALGWSLSAASLLGAGGSGWTGAQWLWIPTLLLAGTAALFGSLVVVIDDRHLRWHFGWLGWPRWSLTLDQIEAIEPVRTRWREGWGLRWTREGMLYNMSGFDAVRITRSDGKRLRLGSDDRATLLARLAPRIRGGELHDAGRPRPGPRR